MFPSLEYFLCIVKHRNITRAAEELHLTQQSLSGYLKRLEEYFGAELITRKPAMNLTPMGSLVYERACQIQQLTTEMDTLRFYYQNLDSVTVGFTPVHSDQVSELLDVDSFKASHPGLILRILNEKLRDLAHSLASRQVDIYIASYVHNPKMPTPSMTPVADFVEKKIGVFGYSAIIHPETLHTYRGADSAELAALWANGVDLMELASMPIVLLGQLKTFIYLDAAERNYPLRLSFESNDIGIVIDMVCRRHGFAIVPTKLSFFPNGLLKFPISAPGALNSQDIFCVSTKTALQRSSVLDLWNMFPEIKAD